MTADLHEAEENLAKATQRLTNAKFALDNFVALMQSPKESGATRM